MPRMSFFQIKWQDVSDVRDDFIVFCELGEDRGSN